MAVAIPVIAAVGAIVSAVGSVKQGQAAQQAGDFNAAVATQNAGIAQQQGDVAVAQQQVQGEKTIGAQTAAFGASGVQGGTGSALDLLRQSTAQSSMDAANIRYNYNLKGESDITNASIDTFSGNTASQNGYYSAAGNLLSGVSNVYRSQKGTS